MTKRPHGHADGRCRELLAELFDYLDGELTPARCRVLKQHLDGCTCCGTLANNLQTAIALCRAEGRRELPARVRRRARQRVSALLDRKARPRRPRP